MLGGGKWAVDRIPPLGTLPTRLPPPPALGGRGPGGMVGMEFLEQFDIKYARDPAKGYDVLSVYRPGAFPPHHRGGGGFSLSSVRSRSVWDKKQPHSVVSQTPTHFLRRSGGNNAVSIFPRVPHSHFFLHFPILPHIFAFSA